MAAGVTYEPLATTTLTATSTTITFSSISGSYTDLRLVFVGNTTVGASVSLRYNSDTATNYSYTGIYGDGSLAQSTRFTNNNELYLIGDAAGFFSTTIFGMVTVDIFSYAGSTFKTSLRTTSADKNGSGEIDNFVGLWRSTSAITTITLNATGTTFASGTTATLYGITKA